MARMRVLPIAVALFSGCATLDHPDPSNLAAYCAPENAYRLGSQSRAYFGVCPKESEAGFLAGLERGRGYRANPPQALPYYQRMEETEKQLLAAASDAERERLRERLREIEWWTIHIVTNPSSYSGGGGRN
jgi:hypothetical protein